MARGCRELQQEPPGVAVYVYCVNKLKKLFILQ